MFVCYITLITTETTVSEPSFKHTCIKAAKIMGIATLSKAAKAMELCRCRYVHLLVQHYFFFNCYQNRVQRYLIQRLFTKKTLILTFDGAKLQHRNAAYLRKMGLADCLHSFQKTKAISNIIEITFAFATLY